MEKTICIFGDSITFGVCDSEKGGWADRLKLLLQKLDIEVYNLGISGDNTEDLLKRFKKESEAREPDYILFAIGINDSHYDDYFKKIPRTNIKKFERNLRKLINQAKKFTNTILFIGLTKVNDSLIKNKYNNEMISKYDNIIKEVSDKTSLTYIKLFDLFEDSDLEDGLHPNVKGHEKIFNKIKKSLAEKNLI